MCTNADVIRLPGPKDLMQNPGKSRTQCVALTLQLAWIPAVIYRALICGKIQMP